MLVTVCCHCHFSFRYRDVSEILKEPGVSFHPTTIMQWVHEYGNLIYQICKKKNKPASFKIFGTLHVQSKESKPFMLYTNETEI